MSRSNDAGHYFQTSDALASTERKALKSRNKYGRPIELPSKILTACKDPASDQAVYVAEAAGEIKRVILETGKLQKILTQATAPLTSLAIHPRTGQLFAGSWDKDIYIVEFSDKRSNRRLSGHTDFVKCVLQTSLDAKPILISGGADAVIIVWDLESGKQLHKLKGHTKALQDFAIDPLSIPEGAGGPVDSFVLFTSSSDREIRRWHISADKAHELPESIEYPISAHDTSVYKLRFDQDGDLWTASADKTSKHLVRSRNWEADTVLQHPDFVRDVVVAENLGLVVTACRDEEVRVWDITSGHLICTYSGHFEEVTGLVLVGSSVVSVSIDGTIRQWGLGRQAMAQYQAELDKQVEGEGSTDEQEKSSMLTAEEEAELAELMDDD